MLTSVRLQSATNGSPSPPFPGGSSDPFVRDGVSLTFLIVEDEAAIALDLQSIIMDAGGQVLGMAATASDAERLAYALRPDIILMDVRLRGERDGIAAAHAIRTQLDTTIVFVTGNEDLDTVARIMATSGGPPVHRPIRPRGLIEAALTALRCDRKKTPSQ